MTEHEDERDFEALLEYIHQSRGVDFTGYKRSSLRRRISKRMDDLHLPGFGALQDHLEVHPEEFSTLIDTVLINVTAFFRDPESWDHLATEVLPPLLDHAGDRPLRVWSAGCASGEEAYTLAMVLAEAIGEEAVRERVKVYATDVDDDALAHARHATYDERQLEAVPPALRERYFTPIDDRMQFRPDLRRSVIFGRHDLVHDAPISRLDLLVCRNVLMYLNRETQGRVLERLHFALRPDGALFLGRAEMLLSRSNLFRPLNLRHRVFEPVRTILRPADRADDEAPASMVSRTIQLRAAALDASPTAQLVLDEHGTVVFINERCRTMFGLQGHDLGRPLRDLEVSYRPVDLRSHVDQAVTERRSILLRSVERRVADQDTQFLDVVVAPLREDDAVTGAMISFADVTHAEQLRARLQQAHQDLETSYEELQSTNEELETTNEELQSANEELETTNEELQSANEELETMNEELQSTNTEQAEVATQLTTRTTELDEANAFLSSILSSLAVGVVVVDSEYTVQIWNARSFDLWGLRDDEVVGRSLLGLDIGLPVHELAGPIRDAFDGREGTVELPAVTRRGRSVVCAIAVTPLANDTRIVGGAVLLVEAQEDADGDG